MDRPLPNRGVMPAVALMIGLGAAAAALLGGPRPAHGQSAANADDFYLAVVTADDVYVRSGGADSYYPFGKVHKGDVVKVIGEKHNWARVLTTGPAFRDFFAYVRYPKSDAGRFEVDATGRKGRTLGLTRALAPNLNTNYEPDDSWKRILLIDADTELEVLETTETSRAVVHKIVMPQNAEGWISTAFLQPASSREIQAWEESIERAALLAAGALPAPGSGAAARPRPLGAAGPDYQGPEGSGVLARDESVVPTMPEPLEESAADVDETLADTAGDLTTTTTMTPRSAIPAAAPAAEPGTDTTMGEAPAPIDEARDVTVYDTTPLDSTTLDSTTPDSTTLESTPAPQPATNTAGSPAPPAVTMGGTGLTDTRLTDTAMADRAMPKPAAPPSPFDRIAASIRNKAPKDALADLEAAYQRLRSEPIETAEVLPLRHLYRSLSSASTGDREVARYADARAEQLTIWADLQERRAELDRIRSRLEVSAEEAEAARLALEQSGTYAAVGRLAISTVFDGVRLPRLYRVQDAATGRTIIYLKPDHSFDLPGMLGQVIGVIGRPSFEENLRLNLVEPKRIDLLAQGG